MRLSKSGNILKAAPVYLGSVLSIITSLLLAKLVIQKLSLNDYGQYVYLLSLSNVVMNFAESRSSETIIFFIPRKEIERLVSQVIILDFIYFVFAGLGVYLILNLLLIFNFLDTNTQEMLIVLISGLPLIFRSSLLGYLNYNKQYLGLAVLRVLPIVLLYMALFSFDNLKLTDIFYVQLGLNTAVGLGSVIILGISTGMVLDLSGFGLVFRYSFKNYFSMTLKGFHEQMDRILVKYMLGLSTLAIYDVVMKIFKIVLFIPNQFSTFLNPLLVRKIYENKSTRKVILSYTLGALLSVMISSFLVIFFKQRIADYYEIDISIFLALSVVLFYLVKSSAFWVRILPLAYGLADIPIISNLIQFAILPILLVVWAPIYGIYGVIMSKTMEVIIVMVFVGWRVRRVTRI